MKIRNSFVSNSSSASFCIPRKELNNEQYKSILQYLINFNTDWWEICFTHRNVIGFTTMDNNDLHAWLKKVNFDLEQYIDRDNPYELNCHPRLK